MGSALRLCCFLSAASRRNASSWSSNRSVVLEPAAAAHSGRGALCSWWNRSTISCSSITCAATVRSVNDPSSWLRGSARADGWEQRACPTGEESRPAEGPTAAQDTKRCATCGRSTSFSGRAEPLNAAAVARPCTTTTATRPRRHEGHSDGHTEGVCIHSAGPPSPRPPHAPHPPPPPPSTSRTRPIDARAGCRLPPSAATRRDRDALDW